jgi:hypothetical protein
MYKVTNDEYFWYGIMVKITQLAIFYEEKQQLNNDTLL